LETYNQNQGKKDKSSIAQSLKKYKPLHTPYPSSIMVIKFPMNIELITNIMQLIFFDNQACVGNMVSTRGVKLW